MKNKKRQKRWRCTHTHTHTCNFIENKTGITLVALVVTIIVLLILAGITISLLFGDNGAITRAQESAFKTEIAKVKIQYVFEYKENGKLRISKRNIKCRRN